ncbi:hypothetical protein K440DRAFT_638221 [Wilcoxina mikolae CBS 423.85]|nr:hypothetical protein K440DRAFT_638221 [Wilcoxina mikolae CBS 423.85]
MSSDHSRGAAAPNYRGTSLQEAGSRRLRCDYAVWFVNLSISIWKMTWMLLVTLLQLVVVIVEPRDLSGLSLSHHHSKTFLCYEARLSTTVRPDFNILCNERTPIVSQTERGDTYGQGNLRKPVGPYMGVSANPVGGL